VFPACDLVPQISFHCWCVRVHDAVFPLYLFFRIQLEGEGGNRARTNILPAYCFSYWGRAMHHTSVCSEDEWSERTSSWRPRRHRNRGGIVRDLNDQPFPREASDVRLTFYNTAVPLERSSLTEAGWRERNIKRNPPPPASSLL